MLATLLLVACSGGAAAELSARHAWVRLLPAGLPAAGYLELDNSGANSVRLVSMQSAYFDAIELHLSSEQSGVARMRRVGNLEIPAGKTVVLAPGGYHLMMFTPAVGLKPGDQVPVTLKFSDGNLLPVNFLLRNAAGQ